MLINSRMNLVYRSRDTLPSVYSARTRWRAAVHGSPEILVLSRRKAWVIGESRVVRGSLSSAISALGSRRGRSSAGSCSLAIRRRIFQSA